MARPIAAVALAVVLVAAAPCASLAQNKTAGEKQLDEEIQAMRDRRSEAASTKAMQDAAQDAIADARARALAGAPERARQKAREAWVKQLVRAGFYAGMADSEVRAITAATIQARDTNSSPDRALLCRNARSAKPYYKEARPLAADVLQRIGRDPFGDFRADKARMTGLIQMDDELAGIVRDCPAEPVTPSPEPPAYSPPRAPDSPPDTPVITLSEGARGACRVEARSPLGRSQGRMQLENGRLKELRYVYLPTPRSAPGKGLAKGGQVQVAFDLAVVGLESLMFDGLGTRLTFPGHTVTGPIDLRITIGDVVLSRTGLTPNAQGDYEVRLGGGVADRDGSALKAFDKASVIEVLARVAGQADQLLLYVDIPVGTPDARDTLIQATLDALGRQEKVGC